MSAENLSVRKRRKEARPAELVAAALELFVDRGFAATRLEDVAALAGVSKGTLYLYFANKEALFQAVVRAGMLPVMDEAEAMLARHAGGDFELLACLLLQWWEKVGATRLSGISKLIVAEAGNFPELARFYHENVIRRGRAMLAGVLRRGMESGEFRRLDIDHCIDLIFAPLFALAVWQHSIHRHQDGLSDPRAVLDTHLELLRGGLLAG